MKPYIQIIVIALIAFVFSSCLHEAATPTENTSPNSVYFWKSIVNLSDGETQFLKDNNVGRVYLRFFDIRDDYREGPVPDAEVYTYKSDFPSGTEIVPCVFITLEAIEDMGGIEKEFAKKIYDRIDSKCKDGNITLNEIQLDCDWTASTRKTFFTLCDEMKKLTSANNQKLSSTIRLHQLSQPAPNVDKGVLMVYNVGELKNPEETNSILRSDIVKKYLDKAPKYQLPLDVAYPIFSWGVVFNGTAFGKLTNIDGDPDTIADLARVNDNVYALQSNTATDVDLDYRQTMRYEMASFEEIMKTKHIVNNYLGYKPAHTILYHLDEKQLSKYTPQQIAKIYE
ncbi:MAG: hypothetical protein NC111_02960 [Bacteroides sp.]|nr:hypothetical protein [Bacteroides sp.]MCM1412810.1 hypothetical protein [Bacteroides sp.]MCM1471479.1 hypothetical protein [Bacteroides sp.]